LGHFIAKKKFFHFGIGSEIRYGAYVVGCNQISIGSNVIIRPGTFVHAESDSINISLEIQDYALIGSGVHIYVENHKYTDPNKFIYFQGHENARKVTIGRGCWIGASAIILPGVTVGQNAVVAAGSIVTKDVLPFTVVAGCPAKVIKNIKSFKD
jgi:acetyltransferase-like isoleucine patch superfamily enzyme